MDFCQLTPDGFNWHEKAILVKVGFEGICLICLQSKANSWVSKLLTNNLLDKLSALGHDLANIRGDLTLDERALESALELRQHFGARYV